MAAENSPLTPTGLPTRVAERPARSLASGKRSTDPFFYGLTLLFACSVVVLCLSVGIRLVISAWPAVQEFGGGFLTSSQWNPVKGVYGALPYIWGTIATSFGALCLAVPIGVGTAIYLSELAPRWMRTPLSFLVELLAAVPSVVYGLWGVAVLVPVLIPAQTWLSKHFGWFPLFSGTPQGNSLMTGIIVLAVMILPFITAVSREVIKSVPTNQREAAYGLGATHWEAVKGPILRYARSGIIGAIILGLARALGETMAMTMVLGNEPKVSVSLFSGASTLASKLANEFAEADNDQLSSLMYLALILFGITILVNAFARFLIWNTTRNIRGASRE